MVLAFKEWSYIVDALGKGKQNLILRKGGISEEEDSFTLKSKNFLLFTTLFHQAENHIKPDWLPKLNGAAFHQPNGDIKIEYFASVAEVKKMNTWEDVKKLQPYHAWTEEIIKERFERWDKNLTALVVLVYKLEKAVLLESLPEYGGCKSWINIAQEIELIGKPVINKNIIQG